VQDLCVSTLPTFGARWLVPRLGRFTRANADIELKVVSRIAPFEFAGSGIDAAIHYGSDAWSGARIEHLMDELMFRCAPRSSATRAGPGSSSSSSCR
jgi:DNA-binding transcriptional LysR family regulator